MHDFVDGCAGGLGRDLELAGAGQAVEACERAKQIGDGDVLALHVEIDLGRRRTGVDRKLAEPVAIERLELGEVGRQQAIGQVHRHNGICQYDLTHGECADLQIEVRIHGFKAGQVERFVAPGLNALGWLAFVRFAHEGRQVESREGQVTRDARGCTRQVQPGLASAGQLVERQVEIVEHDGFEGPGGGAGHSKGLQRITGGQFDFCGAKQVTHPVARHGQIAVHCTIACERDRSLIGGP